MNESPTLKEVLDGLTTELAAASESPRLDAELLLCRAIDVPRSYLFAHPEDVPDAAALERLGRLAERRLQGEPMAYITGLREFWSMELLVSPATLVPRPETERLVELALGIIPRRADWRVLDLGTGSGAIAVAIGKERPLVDLVATDLSPAALAVARENARQQGVPNIEFREGDWLEPVRGESFRLVVSNPPYVREGDPALEALGQEPRAALVAGLDGLDAIRRIVADSREVLAADGHLLIEHGAEQEAAVAGIFREFGYGTIHCSHDSAGLPRVTAARFGAGQSITSKPGTS